MWKIALLVSLIAVCTCQPAARVSSRFAGGMVSGYTPFNPHYLQWTQMKTWLANIRKSSNCKYICKFYNIGKSYQKRKLYVMKIHAPESSGTKKPIIWIDAGIHAREWISHVTALYLISRFVNGYKTDSAIRSLLQKYHVYIMPCINPDGYVYSWTPGNRFWRKNRKPSGNVCVGSDINRNFNHQWDTIGTSNNRCSDKYPGPFVESEPETKAVAKYVTKLHKLRGGVTLFLTLHGYGQIFVSPWGYTTVKPSNYNELMCLAKIAADKIETVYGTKYTYGDSKSTIGYSNSGTSKDWAYGKLGIPYVFTVELRGPPRTTSTTQHQLQGFVLPVSQIIPNGRETWEGFMAMVAGIDTYACLPRIKIPYQRPRIRIPFPIVTRRPFPDPGPVTNPAPFGGLFRGRPVG